MSPSCAEPGELARLAAITTLHLVPHHRVSVQPVQLAATFQRYLDLLRLPPVITHLALFFIHRAAHSPTLDVSTYPITRLFVMAYSLADTHLDDNAYSNKSWCQVLADGIQIREWNRLQAEMWVRGLQYSLEVDNEEWREWCTWLGNWWREQGTMEWQYEWKSHCISLFRPVAVPHSLPTPPADEEPEYFPTASYVPVASVYTSEQQRQRRVQSSRVSAAGTAVDDAGYVEDEDIVSLADSEDFADLYASGEEDDDEEAIQVEQIRPFRADTESPDAYTLMRARMAQMTAMAKAPHTRRASEASVQTVQSSLRGVAMLKSSSSTEFRSYDSAYSTTPSGRTPASQRVRKASLGNKVMAEATEWWENTVLRRVSSIRSIGSTSTLHSRQNSSNCAGAWSPSTVVSSTGQSSKMVNSKLRKDSAIGGMRGETPVVPSYTTTH